MRFISTCLLLCLLPSIAEAQLFRRRERYAPCPDGNCQPYSSPEHPSLPVAPAPEVSPEDASEYVDIPLDARPRNVNGNCVWNASESVFVGAGYDEFRGISKNAVKEGWHGAWITNLEAACKTAGIEYRTERNGKTDIFDYAKSEGVPVYIQIQVSRPNDHAVACLGLNDRYAYILDNNGPPVVQKWSRSKFNSKWNGIACCPLHRKNRKPKEPKTPIVAPVVPETKPVEPAKPAVEPCKCPPPADLSKITNGLDKLIDAVSTTNKSVGELSVKVGSVEQRVNGIDQRLVVVEGMQRSQGSLPPPSTTTPDAIKQVQDDLQKLKEQMRQSGTLKVTVTPKQ